MLSFTINKKDFHLKPKDYILFQQNTCRITIRKSQEGFPFGILGMGFIRGHQILYDMENKRIGIVAAKDFTRTYQESSTWALSNFLDVTTAWITIFVALCVLLAGIMAISVCIKSLRDKKDEVDVLESPEEFNDDVYTY